MIAHRPRMDPYERNYRIRLLPKVMTHRNAALGRDAASADTVERINVRQQRYYCALRCPPLAGNPAPVVDHSSLEPFAYQRQQPAIRNPVLQKLQRPAMIDLVEE
jgi:hypothetical protein